MHKWDKDNVDLRQDIAEASGGLLEDLGPSGLVPNGWSNQNGQALG